MDSKKDVVGNIAFNTVNRPAHYTNYKIEVIDAIEAWYLGYHRGSIIKYVVRAGRKSKETELEDLKKARWFLEREIKRLEEK